MKIPRSFSDMYYSKCISTTGHVNIKNKATEHLHCTVYIIRFHCKKWKTAFTLRIREVNCFYVYIENKTFIKQIFNADEILKYALRF